MKRRLLIWAGLFTAGYLTANHGLPKGEEFLWFAIISWFSGLGAGVYGMKFYLRMRMRQKRWAKKEFRLLGFDFKITRPGTESGPVMKLVVKPEPTAAKMPELAKASCDVCHGETEIRLSGQKIQCPKCKGKAAARI